MSSTQIVTRHRVNLIEGLIANGFSIRSPWPHDERQQGYLPPVTMELNGVKVTWLEVPANRERCTAFVEGCKELPEEMTTSALFGILTKSAETNLNFDQLWATFLSDVQVILNQVKTEAKVVLDPKGYPHSASVMLGDHEIFGLGRDTSTFTDGMFSVYFDGIKWLEPNKNRLEGEPGAYDEPEDFEEFHTRHGLRLSVNVASEIPLLLEEKRPSFALRKYIPFANNTELLTLLKPSAFADMVLRHGIVGIKTTKVVSWQVCDSPFFMPLLDLTNNEYTGYTLIFSEPVEEDK